MNRHLTKEHRDKIALGRLGKKHSAETKLKISQGRLGKNNPFFGKKHSKKNIELYKEINKGNKNPNYRGGKIIGDYIMILMPEHPYAKGGQYVKEHRLIMEKYLGRYLRRNEYVHHINGIKTDNRIENLQLMTPSEHTKFHNDCRKEMLR